MATEFTEWRSNSSVGVIWIVYSHMHNVMDLVDQRELNVSSSCKFNGISEFRGSEEALTVK